MSQRTYCAACGKQVEPGNYCSHCGTGLDEESQRKAELRHKARSEKQRLLSAIEDLKEFSGPDYAALEHIEHRVESADADRFMDLVDEEQKT